MGASQSSNARKIKQGFQGIVKARDIVAERGMKELLDVAMMFALNAHDTRHFGHKITRDSYGWVLLHNGVAVAHKVNEGRHGEGSAFAGLMEKSRSVPQVGWVGIILASMTGETEHARNIYFAVEYEQDILRLTQDDIKNNFGRYFKPI